MPTVDPAVNQARLPAASTRNGGLFFLYSRTRREAVEAAALVYDDACKRGPLQPIYRFGDALIDEDAIAIDADTVHIPGFAQAISLALPNRYPDMT